MSDVVKRVSEAIESYKQPFTITEDGSSQTKLYNTGRVGFFVEKILNIPVNNKRTPDIGDWELKVSRIGKGITIGTMPESEFESIRNSTHILFTDSDPYQKIKQTILVFYEMLERYPDPSYRLLGLSTLDFTSMSDAIKKELQDDYEHICSYVRKCTSRDNLTQDIRDHGTIPGTYLKLTYKGQGAGGYNYPAWKFSDKFMKKLYDERTN
jgi:hypothetical protein